MLGGALALGGLMSSGLNGPTTPKFEFNTASTSQQYLKELKAQENNVITAKQNIKNVDREIYTLKYSGDITADEIAERQGQAQDKYATASRSYVDMLIKDPRATEPSFKSTQGRIPALSNDTTYKIVQKLNPAALEECRFDLSSTDKIIDCMNEKDNIRTVEVLSGEKKKLNDVTTGEKISIIVLVSIIGGLAGLLIGFVTFALFRENWQQRKPDPKNYIKPRGN